MTVCISDHILGFNLFNLLTFNTDIKCNGEASRRIKSKKRSPEAIHSDLHDTVAFYNVIVSSANLT